MTGRTVVATDVRSIGPSPLFSVLSRCVKFSFVLNEVSDDGVEITARCYLCFPAVWDGDCRR